MNDLQSPDDAAPESGTAWPDDAEDIQDIQDEPDGQEVDEGPDAMVADLLGVEEPPAHLFRAALERAFASSPDEADTSILPPDAVHEPEDPATDPTAADAGHEPADDGGSDDVHDLGGVAHAAGHHDPTEAGEEDTGLGTDDGVGGSDGVDGW